MKTILIAIAAASSLSQPAPPAGLHLPESGPAAFDLAGVKLGMTPASARAALTKAGYGKIEVRDGKSFRQYVDRELDGRLDRRPKWSQNTSVRSILAVGPSGEQLSVEFDQWPAGPFATVVWLDLPADRQSDGSFQAQIAAKFAAPNGRTADGGRRWCSLQDEKTECGPLGMPLQPSLSVATQAGGGRLLHLSTGRATERERLDLIKAEVERQAPLKERSAF